MSATTGPGWGLDTLAHRTDAWTVSPVENSQLSMDYALPMSGRNRTKSRGGLGRRSLGTQTAVGAFRISSLLPRMGLFFGRYHDL